MHLIVDGYSSNQSLLKDEGFISQFLHSYPAQIGMNKISSPYVFKYLGTKPEDWGISGFVLIAESHISLHTFVEQNYINIDVFSCRDFDAKKAIEDLQAEFQLVRLRSYIVDRSWKNVPATEAIKIINL